MKIVLAIAMLIGALAVLLLHFLRNKEKAPQKDSEIDAKKDDEKLSKAIDKVVKNLLGVALALVVIAGIAIVGWVIMAVCQGVKDLGESLAKSRTAPSTSTDSTHSVDNYIEQVWANLQASGGLKIDPLAHVEISFNPTLEQTKTAPLLLRGMSPGSFKVRFSGPVPHSANFLRISGSARCLETFPIENGQSFNVMNGTDPGDIVTVSWSAKEKPLNETYRLTLTRTTGPAALIIAYKNIEAQRYLPVGFIPLKQGNQRRDSDIYIVATNSDESPLSITKDQHLRLVFSEATAAKAKSPAQELADYTWHGRTNGLSNDPVLALSHTFDKAVNLYVIIVPQQ